MIHYSTMKALCFSYKNILLLILFNTLIALFLYGVGIEPLWANLVFSHAIGFSIMGLIVVGVKRWGEQLWVYPLGIVLGGVLGSMAGVVITGKVVSQTGMMLTGTMGSALLFGSAISWYFYSRERMSRSEAALQQAELERVGQERNLLESNLKLLQAQIEPHFLFNTLSNIQGLIGRQPALAQEMVEQLSQFLRTSLQRTRSELTTVDQELTLLQHYLRIQQIRMGERLQFTITCDPRLRQMPLPPLLIQPLVENAIQHGIEPQVEGGAIEVVVQQNEKGVEIMVSDNGAGLDKMGQQGIGLNNIRQRLQQCYGEAARLQLGAQSPHGVVATMRLSESER